MYRKHHNGQLSIEDFHVPFGGTLDSDNRWVIFSSLMPWEELEETYAPQFNPTTGAPAKPVRLAFGALFIKQRLGLTDEETVEQIRENAYMQFFLGFAGYSSKAPFDPSMMVHFRKRFSEDELSRINELIAERGKAMVMEAVAARQDDDDPHDPDASAGSQLSIDDFVKPADWPEGRNWGTLSIDASCTPGPPESLSSAPLAASPVPGLLAGHAPSRCRADSKYVTGARAGLLSSGSMAAVIPSPCPKPQPLQPISI